MNISDRLEALARYRVQQRTAVGPIDPATEQLSRFKAILDMAADDGNAQSVTPDRSEWTLLSAALQSSLYSRMLQALSVEMSSGSQTSAANSGRTLPGSGMPDPATGTTPRVGIDSAPADRHGDRERIDRSVTRAAKRYNLPEHLIHGIIQAESAYHPQAVSAAGAQGLMQLMPETARELGVTDPFNIEQNIDGGARYLRAMIDRFDGDVPKAVAAYNAGPGTVERYHGRVPYPETIAYVDRVLRYSNPTQA